jgi:hypothetical protein
MSYQLKYNRNSNFSPRGITTNEANYLEAYEPVKQLSVLNEPDMKYESKIHFLHITSGARESSQPLHYDYYIKLQEIYKNVTKVEMISATFPNITPNINNQPYLVFDIKELNCIDFITGDNNHNGFAVLPIKPSSSSFINPELGCMFHTVYYPNPTIKLERLTIKIRDVTGALYDFGSPNGSTNPLLQHSFMLKITTNDANKESLNVRQTY